MVHTSHHSRPSSICPPSLQRTYLRPLLLLDRDVSYSGLSSSLLLLSICCVSTMFLSHCDERDGVGNILERTSGVGDAGGVSCMRSVYKASYVQSVSGGRCSGSADRYNEEKMDLFNDKDFMPIFIDMYRELACLWQVNHPFYNNKPKRKAALDQLVEFVKPVIPTGDIPYLKALIGGMRSTYNRELKKVQDSLRSGAAAHLCTQAVVL
ncbi:hypothetical protein AB205_0056770 [Aquarana catesbeiana]|uniref:MADF domain-containing protein n=1 Tax=Aquarana catesbeiana TaxID=8400 RepID=A0A2G9RCI9_AQUCT|nr:hypothetical protein AB205_0056770 [Aquarana catesbeiana]